MKIQLNGTLKGTEGKKSKTWIKGERWDESAGDIIPKDILIELNAKNPIVEVIPDISDPESLKVSDERLDQLVKEIAVEREEKVELVKEREDLKAKLDAALEELAALKKAKIEKNPMDNETNLFPCPVEGCGRTFEKARGLSTHLRQNHPDYKPDTGD